jgi:hypothetical protein
VHDRRRLVAVHVATLTHAGSYRRSRLSTARIGLRRSRPD